MILRILWVTVGYFGFRIHLPGGRSDHFPGSTPRFSYTSGKIMSLSRDRAVESSEKLLNWWLQMDSPIFLIFKNGTAFYKVIN